MGGRVIRIGLALAGLLAFVALSWRFDLFGLRSITPFSSVAAAFDEPPRYPGYRWTREGRAVGEFELTTIGGPDHCGWQSASFLFIGWPPGTVAPTAAGARQYVRDPRGVLPGSFRGRLDLHAALPADARPTGYRYGALELYLAPSDQDQAIYVAGPGAIERWPRSEPMTLCD